MAASVKGRRLSSVNTTANGQRHRLKSSSRLVRKESTRMMATALTGQITTISFDYVICCFAFYYSQSCDELLWLVASAAYVGLYIIQYFYSVETFCTPEVWHAELSSSQDRRGSCLSAFGFQFQTQRINASLRSASGSFQEAEPRSPTAGSQAQKNSSAIPMAIGKH